MPAVREKPRKSGTAARTRSSRPAAREGSATPRRKGGGWWWRFPLKCGLYLGVAGTVALVGVMLAYGAIAKRFDLGKLGAMPERSVVFDRNGEIIGRLHGSNRAVVGLDAISPFFLKALLAREDARFYAHGGIDFIGVARSTVRNVKSKRVVQGASTLTMQLARNSYDLSDEKSFHRKLIEVMLARRIERNFTKDEILAHYVNRIFFGSGIHGIERASQEYFGKPARAMTLDEAALIAGIIRAPNRFSPFRHYDEALRERDTVLDRMVETGDITATEAAGAKTVRTRVLARRKLVRQDSYALDAVRRDLDLALDASETEDGGLEIRTHLDLRLQKATERALEAHLASIETLPGYTHRTRENYTRHGLPAGQKPDYLQGAVVVIDNATGGLLALVGGRDYRQSKFNRALFARRPVGSVFKPFVYAAAFDNGLATGTLIDDGPLRPGEIEGDTDPATGAPWQPRNADNTFLGLQPAAMGLVKSRNTMTARVGEWAGLDHMLSLAGQLGFGDTLRPSAQLYIGNLETDLRTLTGAYTIFPNQGRRVPPLTIDRITNAAGDTFLRTATDGYPVITTGAAIQVSKLLQMAMNPGGTAAAAREWGFNDPAGGKTGTTNDFHDAWFIGYTSAVTCGVWIGLDTPAPIVAQGYASRLALPVWTDVLRVCGDLGYPAGDLNPKIPLAKVTLCRLTGKFAAARCRELGHAYETSIPYELAPKSECAGHGTAPARKSR